MRRRDKLSDMPLVKGVKELRGMTEKEFLLMNLINQKVSLRLKHQYSLQEWVELEIINLPMLRT